MRGGSFQEEVRVLTVASRLLNGKIVGGDVWVGKGSNKDVSRGWETCRQPEVDERRRFFTKTIGVVSAFNSSDKLVTGSVIDVHIGDEESSGAADREDVSRSVLKVERKASASPPSFRSQSLNSKLP